MIVFVIKFGVEIIVVGKFFGIKISLVFVNNLK